MYEEYIIHKLILISYIARGVGEIQLVIYCHILFGDTIILFFYYWFKIRTLWYLIDYLWVSYFRFSLIPPTTSWQHCKLSFTPKQREFVGTLWWMLYQLSFFLWDILLYFVFFLYWKILRCGNQTMLPLKTHISSFTNRKSPWICLCISNLHIKKLLKC